MEEIEEKFYRAVVILLDQIRTNLKPAEAQQQTQSLLNMAHAKPLLLEGLTKKKQGASAS